MLNKKGWSALEYLIMTVTIVAGLILGAVSIKQATKSYLDKTAEKIENAVN